MTLKWGSSHISRVSLARFTFCWWRHNRLAITSQWPGNSNANTWQVISNSLDIDFIHGDIHGRSCKNVWLSPTNKSCDLCSHIFLGCFTGTGVIIWLPQSVSVSDVTLKDINENYRKVSNIRRTKSQNLNDSRLVMQMSLSNLLKPGFKSRMKM